MVQTPYARKLVSPAAIQSKKGHAYGGRPAVSPRYDPWAHRYTRFCLVAFLASNEILRVVTCGSPAWYTVLALVAMMLVSCATIVYRVMYSGIVPVLAFTVMVVAASGARIWRHDGLFGRRMWYASNDECTTMKSWAGYILDLLTDVSYIALITVYVYSAIYNVYQVAVSYGTRSKNAGVGTLT